MLMELDREVLTDLLRCYMPVTNGMAPIQPDDVCMYCRANPEDKSGDLIRCSYCGTKIWHLSCSDDVFFVCYPCLMTAMRQHMDYYKWKMEDGVQRLCRRLVAEKREQKLSFKSTHDTLNGDPKDITVPNLKKMCKSRGLSAVGNKQQLTSRLRAQISTASKNKNRSVSSRNLMNVVICNGNTSTEVLDSNPNDKSGAHSFEKVQELSEILSGDPMKLGVSKLKKHCQSRDLRVSGNKGELVARLKAYLETVGKKEIIGRDDV